MCWLDLRLGATRSKLKAVVVEVSGQVVVGPLCSPCLYFCPCLGEFKYVCGHQGINCTSQHAPKNLSESYCLKLYVCIFRPKS